MSRTADIVIAVCKGALAQYEAPGFFTRPEEGKDQFLALLKSIGGYPFEEALIAIHDFCQDSVKCGLVLMSSPPDMNTVNTSQIKSNMAYVVSGRQLFYVNKVKKECTEILITEEKLGKFDKELNPTHSMRLLLEDELNAITLITGHTPKITAPRLKGCIRDALRVLLFSDAESEENLSHTLQDVLDTKAKVEQRINEIKIKMEDQRLKKLDQNLVSLSASYQSQANRF